VHVVALVGRCAWARYCGMAGQPVSVQRTALGAVMGDAAESVRTQKVIA